MTTPASILIVDDEPQDFACFRRQVASAIKANPATSNTPIIMVTVETPRAR